MMNHQPIKHWIIEGVDRLGKSTLINNIMQVFGYHVYVHYEKPKELMKYVVDSSDPKPLRNYQRESFKEGFKLLSTPVRTIYDRFHLGEHVYSELYRGYSGDYVFNEIEDQYCVQWPDNPDTRRMVGAVADGTRMILLTTSDFSFIRDDGESFDFSKKEIEQQMFIDAFNKSMIPNKIIVDVSNGNGGFKDPNTVFKEAVGWQ